MTRRRSAPAIMRTLSPRSSPRSSSRCTSPGSTSARSTPPRSTFLITAPRAALALAFALALGACSTAPTEQAANDATAAGGAAASQTSASTPGPDAAWLSQRARYMDCVQERAKANLGAKGTARDVAASALEACKSQLDAMHDAFQDYLSAQMSSSHGKSSARQAANRVTTDTREKARSYLTQYVERQRYELGQR